MDMIRVMLGEEYGGWRSVGCGFSHGVWHWYVRLGQNGNASTLEGYSRQPLLDACRELQRIGTPLTSPVGLFREGRSKPDLFCTVEAGAGLTVREDVTRFCKWKPYPMGARHLKGTKEL